MDHLRAVLNHRLLRGPALRRAAQQQQWKLSWIGDTGSNCGLTPRGGTAWKQRTAHGLRLHVDTAPNSLLSSRAQSTASTASSLTSSEIVYLPSLLGLRSHWRLRGQSTVRFATERGFDLFIFSIQGLPENLPVPVMLRCERQVQFEGIWLELTSS